MSFVPKIKFSARTHPGLLREKNEDDFLCEPNLGIFLVADGMGGHEAGEIASKIACSTIKEFVEKINSKQNKKVPFPYKKSFPFEWNILLGAISLANGKIIKYAEQKRYLTGMGTTIVAVLLYDSQASYAHVGDSRLYLFKNNILTLLTEDHSWVQEQIKLGNLTPEEAPYHPLKNVLTRALGGSSKLSIDIADTKIEKGDKFLLCSDGLNSVVPDALIEEILEENEDIEKCTEIFLEETLKRGAPDNITVVLLEIC